MCDKEKDYEKALKMIDWRIRQYADVFETNDCDKVINGPELTRKEELLMHLLDELAVLNIYGARDESKEKDN